MDADRREVFNVKDYGAEGNRRVDDSGAFQKVIEEIASAGKGVLYVPPGDYRFDRRVSLRTSENLHVAVVGEGQGLSNLYADNADGVLQLHTGSKSHVAIRNLSFFAARRGAGTAIEVKKPISNRHYRTFEVFDVEMRSLRTDRDYFDYGLKSLNQNNPIFSNVIAAGPFTGGVNRDRTKDSPLYAATCGILLDGSYAPVLTDCHSWSAQTGFSLVAEADPIAPEGGWFYNCTTVGVRTGFDVRTIGSVEPGLAIDRCHINAREVGLRLRRKDFSVTNCLLYNSFPGDDYEPEEAPDYIDILVEAGRSGIISENIFKQPFNVNRTAIELAEAEGHNPVDSKVSNMVISNNVFHHPGTALRVAPDATDIICTDNLFNTGKGPITGIQLVSTVIEDRSGKVAFASSKLRAAALRKEDDQRIPDADWTLVEWQEAEHDTGGFWSTEEPAGFVVPPNRGINFVRLTANVAWEANDDGWRQAEFRKNGEAIVGSGTSSQHSGANEDAGGISTVQNLHSAVIPVAPGDELSLRVRQTSGGALGVRPGPRTWFSIEAVDG